MSRDPSELQVLQRCLRPTIWQDGCEAGRRVSSERLYRRLAERRGSHLWCGRKLCCWPL